MKISILTTMALAVSITSGLVQQAAAATTIQVFTAPAPNAFGSPSYAGWVANAVGALKTGAITGGTVGTPQYAELAPGNTGNYAFSKSSIVTGFNSWQGQAPPSNPAFAAELGNRMLFPLRVESDVPFSISALSFNAVGTGVGSGLNFGFAAGSYNYSNDYRGILAGPDNVLWTFDDVEVTSGPNTQLVDALVGRGSGNGYAVYSTDPGLTNQDKIDNFVGLYGLDANAFQFTGTYSLSVPGITAPLSGSATANYNASASVPDTGSTLGLMALAFVGLAVTKKAGPKRA